MTRTHPESAPSPAVLAIDVGLSVVKVGLYGSTPVAVSLHETRNSAVTGSGCRSEIDLERLWQTVSADVQRVVSERPARTVIAGVAVGGAGNGLVVLGPDDRTVCAVTSMDTRAAPLVSRWREGGEASSVRNATGNHLWPGQPHAILAALRDEGALPRETRLCFLKDWVRYRLTGLLATDRTDASAAALVNAETGEWDRTALDLVDLRDTAVRLPDLLNSSDQAGAVTGEASAQTGLRAGTPVFAGGIDLALGSWADGTVEADALHVTAGTWSINQRVWDGALCDGAGVTEVLQVIVAPDGLRRILVESSPTSALNLGILRGMLETDEPDYAAWEAAVAGATPALDAPMYLPYPAGAWDLPGRTAEFRGLRVGLGPEDVVTAVYDGIAMGHARQIRKFERISLLQRIRICGGMCRSRAWCRLLCDYVDVPLEIVSDPHSSLRGAALCALVGLGVGRAGFSPATDTLHPEPSPEGRARLDRFCNMVEGT